MKRIQKILPVAVMTALVLGTAAPAFAQAPERLPLEEWQAQLDECNRREAAAASQIADLDRQIADMRSQIAGVDGQITQARADVQSLNQQVSNTQNQIAQARAELERIRFPSTYEVVKGDCLWNIAKKDYIYNDPFQWPRIYEANKDQIKDPDLIYPKQVFTIPRP